MSADLYTSLSSSLCEIRLVTLLPGRWTEHIQCELGVVSLDDKLEYFALSYVWGDPLVTNLITINGAEFPVTANLYAALRRIRRVDEPCLIWIDAICINQADVNERTQQVNIMGKIYKSTKEVLIWLGEVPTPLELNKIVWHDDERDYVMVDDLNESNGISQTLRSGCAQIADVHGAFAFFRVIADGKHLFEMPFFGVTEGKRLNTGRGWEQALHGLEVLVGLPWWSRVWVLQETVLPPKATVLYGNIVAPWTMIVRATSHWVRHIHFCCHNYFDSRPIKERETVVMLRDLINRVEIVRTMRAKNVRTSLSQLLSMTMHRLATDSRDKVYALLALVTNWSGREPLSADYQLNVGQLWCQVVVEEIQGSRSLQILQGIRNESIPGLPSWVVRTSSEHLRNKQEQRIVHTTIHNASKQRLADIEVALDSTLGVLGHSGVDTVLCVSSYMWGTPETSYYKLLKVFPFSRLLFPEAYTAVQ